MLPKNSGCNFPVFDEPRCGAYATKWAPAIID
jgi:hypothetical protein